MEMEKRFDNLDEKVNVLRTDVDILKTDVAELKISVSDLTEAVHVYSEQIDQKFATKEDLKAFATKEDMRNIVDDAFVRYHEKTFGTMKKIDLHVDAVVDTLAEDGTITHSAQKTLHTMQPFPKLVKDA